MSPSESNLHEGEPRSLDLCPECGYSFNGLPAEGQCPECGFAYSRDQVVAYGWYSNSEGTSHWYALAAGMVCTPLVLVLGWAVISSWLIVFALLAVARLIYAHLQRQSAKRQGRGPIQLRLFPQGYAVRQGCGPADLRPWKHALRMTVAPIREGHYRIMIRAWLSVGGQRISIDVALRNDELRRIERLGKWRVGRGFRFEPI